MNLVIGGSGLVGSHLLLELLSRGEKVKVFIRPSSSKNQILKIFQYHSHKAQEYFNQLEWITGDILDIYSLSQAMKGVYSVYHCAAMVSFAPKNKELLYRNNVEGTANVVNACLQYPGIKLCFVSSIAALGNSEASEEVTEAHSWKPTLKRTVYSVSKFKSEMEIWRGIEEGLNAFIVNPSVIIGPGNWANSSSAFFPLVYKGLKFYTGGITGYVDVRDLARAMVLLMHSPQKNDRFIVSAENLSFRELFCKIAVALHVKQPIYQATPIILRLASWLDGLKSLVTFSERKISDDTISAATSSNYYSNKKLRETLNFQFHPVEETIENCAQIFLQEKSK